MKLLVSDVEGTIFQPRKIKGAQHASYIWTAIAEALGKDAEREEINTQRKWREGGYGLRKDGQAYVDWVNDSIGIHVKYKLGEQTFVRLIDEAPYVDGVVEFFARLDRNKYIPILISGGIQNLNERACRELCIDADDSYAACKYFFNAKNMIDKDLTFSNTCNFYGKQELVQIALRKYGLGNADWVYMGDGINDVSVAEWATKQNAVSIGISPIDDLKEVASYTYDSFNHMMEDNELMAKLNFFTSKPSISREHTQIRPALEIAKNNVTRQVGKLNLEALETRAIKRLSRIVGHISPSDKRKFVGIEKLLLQGELSLILVSAELREKPVVSALLQPFSSAAESMIYICLALTDDKQYIGNLLNYDFSLRKHRERIENPGLRKVMREYFHNRNISAHTFQEISADAAKTFIRRTYEIIQRLELIIDPYN